MTTTAPEPTSFIDLPIVTDLSALAADLAFLGIPHGTPYVTDESPPAAAPSHLRRISSRFRQSLHGGHNFDFGGELLAGRALRLVDCGDVAGSPSDAAGNSARATQAVRSLLQAGAIPIVLGGDDSVPIPVARAWEEHGPLVVVQIDQHLDFKDEVNGIREGYSSPMRRISEMPWVSQVIQIGQHGIGRSGMQELAEATAAGHTILTERWVHEHGVAALLDAIPANASYFISLDVDGLEPGVMPACSHPEPGGLTFHEAQDLLAGLAARGRVAGMGVFEFVPEHDLHGLGARTIGRLVLGLINAIAKSLPNAQGRA